MHVAQPQRLFFVESGLDMRVIVQLANAGDFFRFFALYSLGLGLLGFQFCDGHGAAFAAYSDDCGL